MTRATGSPIWPVVMDSMYGTNLHLQIVRGCLLQLDGSGMSVPISIVRNVKNRDLILASLRDSFRVVHRE